MGWFKKFRTGRTAARKASERATQEATRLGEQHLGVQQAFGEDIRGATSPGMQQGQDAASLLSGYYSGDPDAQNQFIQQAQQSPFYQSMIDQGEGAIARHAQATGGFRSGTTQQNLAQNSQNVLGSIVNQNLQGNQYLANYGMQNQGNYLNSMSNNIAGQGQTLSGIANANFADATNKSNQAAGMMGLYGGIAKSGLGALGSYLGV